MADLSVLKVPAQNGTTLDLNIKDSTARGLLNGHSVGKNVPSDAVFTDTTYSNATTTTAGLMSAADKSKLDGMSGIVISDTEPTVADPLIWIDPDTSESTQVLTTDDLPGFAGITLTTVLTIENE